MTHRDQLVTDAAVFTETTEYGETISYKPQGGTAKSIEAVILRGQPDTTGQDRDRAVLNRAEIWISKNATLGVSSVKKGFDKVSFPPIEGETATDWTILEVMNRDDPGMWHLTVGR